MTDVRALKDKAAALTQKGKTAAALEVWQQVAAATPDDVGAHQKVAEFFVKLGKKGDAAKVYEDVARRYAQKGLFFKASAVCRLLVGIDPAHQRTQEYIAAMYAKDSVRKPLGKAAVPATPAPAPAPAPVEVDIDIEVEEPVVPSAAAAALPTIPLFSTLTQEELREVLSTAMEVRAFAPGEVVVLEGAPGDSMFALVEGSASVFRGWGTGQQRRVAQVAAGDIFGEAAMVSGAPRLATVVADGDAVALEIRREAMAAIIGRHPLVGQRVDEFYRERLLANVLRASPILRSLPEADKQALAASFQPCTFVDGQRVISEGQPADSVYLLLRGVCAVSHQSGSRYPDLREGDLFGEVSVLTDGAATASVTAAGPVLTLRLSAGEFKTRVMREPEARHAVEKLVKARLTRTALFDQAFAPEQEDDRRV